MKKSILLSVYDKKMLSSECMLVSYAIRVLTKDLETMQL